MDLRTYLLNHKGTESNNKKHAKLIRQVISNPKKIGIREKYESFTNILLVEKSQEIGECDIVFYNPKYRPIVVECKTVENVNDWLTDHSRYVSNKQLRRARNFFMSNFNQFPITIRVSKGNSLERLHHRIVPAHLDEIPNPIPDPRYQFD